MSSWFLSRMPSGLVDGLGVELVPIERHQRRRPVERLRNAAVL
jgi:hypothetical protein